jgi:hypothetical protein
MFVSDPAVNQRFPATIILAMAKLGAGRGREAGLDKTGGHCPVYLGGRGGESSRSDRSRPLGCVSVQAGLRIQGKARAMARTNRKQRGKFALAAPRVEVVLVPEEQPTSADQVALAAGTLFDAYLVLHVPDGEPPKTIRLDGGPFDKEGAINIILATYSTLTEKYAEAHLKRAAKHHRPCMTPRSRRTSGGNLGQPPGGPFHFRSKPFEGGSK